VTALPPHRFAPHFRLGGVLTRAAAVLLALGGLWIGTQMGASVASGTPADAATPSQAESEDAETLAALDLQLSPLSAAPAGSLTEAYLSMMVDEEGGES
jgi:hypothetical protein